MNSNKELKLVPGDSISEEVLAKVIEIEKASYPSDEAASPAAVRFRRESAGEYFYVALDGSDVIAFVMSTLSEGEELSENTMSSHKPEGTVLCIHSVVTKEEFRKQGIARAVLRRFLEEIGSNATHVKTVLLLSKTHLIPFYESCGFQDNGESNVDHGADVWHEMKLELRKMPIACLNAFCNPEASFSGNPAAVCIVPFDGTRSLEPKNDWKIYDSGIEAKCEKWMKGVAAQMNLSETAFLRDLGQDAREPEAHRFELRWLTPTSEVDLCGHATLATACALWNQNVELSRKRNHFQTATKLIFETRSGELCASKAGIGAMLDFPLEQAEAKIDASDIRFDSLCEALKLDADDIASIEINRLDFLVRLKSRKLVQSCQPDLPKLAKLESKRAVCITAEGDGVDFDFVSRLFGPSVGIDEDPFTGSSHCYLGPFWARILNNKTTLRAEQLSARTGCVTVEVHFDTGRVSLTGFCELAWTGDLFSSPFT